MSFVNFMFRGLGGEQVGFCRSSHPADSGIEKYADVNTAKGTITKDLQNDSYKTIHVDNAYKFTTLSDKIRSASIRVWQNLQNQSQKAFIACLIGGILGIVTSLALGILLPPLYPVAIAVAILSLAIFGGAGLAKRRSIQAADQMQLWVDPTLANIRKICRSHEYGQTLDKANSVQREAEQILAGHVLKFKNRVEEHIQKIEKLSQEDNKDAQALRADALHNLKMEVDLYVKGLKAVSNQDAINILLPYCGRYSEIQQIIDQL